MTLRSPDRHAGASQHIRSWYAATANPHPLRPRLAERLFSDVVVVGGGYTGLSTALELAERGLDVVLLEAERVGWGASGRNGGQAVTGFNKPLSTIAAWIGRDDALKLWGMAEEAKAILRERVARHRIVCDLEWGYVLGALKPRHLAELHDHLEEWRQAGYGGGRMLGRDEIRAMVDCPGYIGGLHDAGSGQLHPLNYALGLAAAAEAAGVRIFEGSAVERLEPGDPVVAVTAQGRVEARFAALCGNAYLPPIAPGVERAVRSRAMPVATYMIATEPLGDALARAVVPSGAAVADVNFVLNYYRLVSDTRLLFGGGVSYSGYDPPALPAQMRRKMARTLPLLADAKVEYSWGGTVSITRHRVPHLGRLAPNVLFAQGYSGHGLLLTGIAGRVMAEAIAGQAGRFDVFARLPHPPFPGGRALRTPALVLAMTWYRLRDLL